MRCLSRDKGLGGFVPIADSLDGVEEAGDLPHTLMWLVDYFDVSCAGNAHLWPGRGDVVHNSLRGDKTCHVRQRGRVCDFSISRGDRDGGIQQGTSCDISITSYPS